MIERRQFLGGGAAFALAAVLPHEAIAKGPSHVAGALDAYLAPFVAARDFSGIVVMERGGKRVATRTYGRANFDYGIGHSLDTRYAAESINKMFTRASVLALQANRKLSLDDPLARFIPDFPRAREITIRELVEHRAGISRDLPLGPNALETHSTADLVAMIARTENSAPGKQVAYSNNGYRLLARVIELAGGGGFDALVRELVLEPHGMRDTVFGGFGEVMARRATGYVPGPGWGTLVEARPFNFANARGEASFYTTANDLLRFLRTLPMEPADLAEAKKTDASGRKIPLQVGHDGFGNGFANLAYAYPDQDARLVLLGNIQSGLFTAMHEDLRDILFGLPAKPPFVERPPALPPAPRWAAFVGNYELRPGNPLVIRSAGDFLEVSAGEDFHPLIAIGANRFFMRLRYATLTFPPGPGPVTSMRWEEGGVGYDMKKLA